MATADPIPGSGVHVGGGGAMEFTCDFVTAARVRGLDGTARSVLFCQEVGYLLPSWTPALVLSGVVHASIAVALTVAPTPARPPAAQGEVVELSFVDSAPATEVDSAPATEPAALASTPPAPVTQRPPAAPRRHRATARRTQPPSTAPAPAATATVAPQKPVTQVAVENAAAAAAPEPTPALRWAALDLNVPVPRPSPALLGALVQRPSHDAGEWPSSGAGGGRASAAHGRSVRSVQEVDRPPVMLSSPSPRYSEDALRLGIEGDAVVSIVVGVDGRVSDAEIVRSPGHGLDGATLEAASRLRFRPAVEGGRPVAVRARWVCRFRLP